MEWIIILKPSQLSLASFYKSKILLQRHIPTIQAFPFLALIFKWGVDNIIMLYGRLAQGCRSLLHRSSSPFFIYLRDHNQHITPEDSRLNLSYARPSNLVPDMPKHKFINFKLDPELEELLERQIFEEYKSKVLRGIVDEIEEKQPDPLWGQEPVPIHYFNRLSKVNLMAVTHPQRLDLEPALDATYSPYFATSYSQDITPEVVESCSNEDIAELCLKARQDGAPGEIWFAIEERLARGKKLYLLTSEQLIKMKYAFEGHAKAGTPIFHEILSSLLTEDIPKMNLTQLLHLFYACRHANPGHTNLQPNILEALKPLYPQLSFEQKVDFLLSFTLSTKPMKFQKKAHKRRQFQFKELAASVIFRLNFWDLELTNERVAKLIFSLAKLRLDNTKFITLPIVEFINSNFQGFTADKDALFQAAVYLPELENGEGVVGQEFLARLKQVALGRWEEFSKIQQIRLVHSFWNYGLMDETLLEYYKGIELQPDSTLLYYASQIELGTSSEREYLIIQLAVMLDHIPLPYYPAFRRFHNYIKATTEWNLTPLHEKLLNTEYYYDVMRLYDNHSQVKPYKALREYEKFTSVSFVARGAPIENLELAHFAYPEHQVSLDIVTKKDYIPGTTQFKETYMNKVRSLKNIGWKHLAFDEDEIKGIPLVDFIKNVQDCYLPYVEEQKAIIDYADFQKGEEVETNKLYRDMADFDIKFLNKMEAVAEGRLEEEDEIEVDPITGEKRIKSLIPADMDAERKAAKEKAQNEQKEQKKKKKK